VFLPHGIRFSRVFYDDDKSSPLLMHMDDTCVGFFQTLHSYNLAFLILCAVKTLTNDQRNDEFRGKIIPKFK
jgi:hypothetical protein